MAKIIKNNPIHDAIEGIEIEQEQRNYIGYSSIGGKCKRKLWYDYRNVYKHTIPLRVSRLFNRGNAEEPIIIRDLERAGMKVFDKQLEVVNKKFPQLKGHIDGCVSNVLGYDPNEVMLLEMKTANHARFENIKKKGVELFDDAYWTQMNGYLSELGLKRCLYVITNKNNDERLYLIYEFDKSCVADIPYIVEDILDSNSIPKQIGDAIWYECKFCNAYKLCHGADDITENCRNCKFGSPICDFEEGAYCGLIEYDGKPFSYDGKKCNNYIKLEVLR